MTDKKITVYVVDYRRKYLVLQWTDPTTGKRKSQSSKCTKRRDAERAAGELEDRLNSLIPRGDGRIAWADFRDRYENGHLASLEETSHARAQSALNVFDEACAPSMIRSVTTTLLSDYANALRRLGRSEATIVTHFGIIRTALRWAKEQGYLADVPQFPRVAKGKRKRSKGRPLTGEEFGFMVLAASKVVGQDAKDSWRRLLIGLWLSGLRLDEALSLTWEHNDSYESRLWIVTSGKYPLLGISADAEKGKQHRLLPITPDFGRWLLETPKKDRIGLVFPLVKKRRQDARNLDHVSKVISEIGRESGVVVNAQGKFASAHDLRRSFGLRWAHKCFPAELQQLMRHEDISTTMEYYALIEATSFADRLWKNERNTQHNTDAD